MICPVCHKPQTERCEAGQVEYLSGSYPCSLSSVPLIAEDVRARANAYMADVYAGNFARVQARLAQSEPLDEWTVEPPADDDDEWTVRPE